MDITELTKQPYVGNCFDDVMNEFAKHYKLNFVGAYKCDFDSTYYPELSRIIMAPYITYQDSTSIIIPFIGYIALFEKREEN